MVGGASLSAESFGRIINFSTTMTTAGSDIVPKVEEEEESRSVEVEVEDEQPQLRRQT